MPARPGVTGPMLPETTCPHCFRNGFVHAQRVIRGDLAVQAFRCTACDYEWETEDPPDSEGVTLPGELSIDRE